MKDKAISKLRKELEGAKDKSFADPIINYLIERLGEDEGLAEDVMKEQKTWKQCSDYIYEKAKRKAEGKNSLAVVYTMVFEWAEDYYRATDKDVESIVAAKASNKPSSKPKTTKTKNSTFDKEKALEKATAKVEQDKAGEEEKEPEILAKPQPKRKKAKKQTDEETGQMSIFDLFGGIGG